ncbi:hypothetical protein OVA24_17325 [Luteolibacter sp. SL250]|uniref:hypothetical protein n=1 Tax=Luteolibacter sp. SL250 TaxID=2995170 RepID=UPI0022719CFE|nr:hypothetical protein [Luteolibacter sp. SL250]WAC18993.1 hypothetical protein OVA24_17325 [Luteolibacter sp. SL250]
MIHVCTRYHLICPAYCLMPDHGHFLLVGLADSSDQRNGMKLFRKHWNHLLSATGHELQRQAYEHVLDENERNPDAFEDTMLYILNNPVSAGLVGDWREWEHLGAIAAGYPEFDPRGGSLSGFRERFWKVHHKERRKWQGDSPP